MSAYHYCSSHAPIAYTYEADHHCPTCTEARFGKDERGDIAGEGSEDSEGNPIGAIFSWDEWSTEPGDTLACGNCHDVLDTTYGGN